MTKTARELSKWTSQGQHRRVPTFRLPRILRKEPEGSKLCRLSLLLKLTGAVTPVVIGDGCCYKWHWSACEMPTNWDIHFKRKPANSLIWAKRATAPTRPPNHICGRNIGQTCRNYFSFAVTCADTGRLITALLTALAWPPGNSEHLSSGCWASGYVPVIMLTWQTYFSVK